MIASRAHINKKLILENEPISIIEMMDFDQEITLLLQEMMELTTDLESSLKSSS